MKNLISLLIFFILIAGSHQRKKCFSVMTPEDIDELKQIILIAGLDESQLNKFIKAARLIIQVSPDVELSKFNKISEIVPDYLVSVLKNLTAAGLDHFISDTRKNMAKDIKDFLPTLSSDQIQQIIKAYEIKIMETRRLIDYDRIRDFITDLDYFILDVTTKGMNLPANYPNAPIITPQVKRNLRKAVLKAGLEESQTIQFIKSTRILVKIGLKVDMQKIEELATKLPDFFVDMIRNVTAAGLDHFTPDFKTLIEMKVPKYAPNLTKNDVQSLIRAYEILTFAATSIEDDNRIRKLVIDVTNIMDNIIREHKTV